MRYFSASNRRRIVPVALTLATVAGLLAAAGHASYKWYDGKKFKKHNGVEKDEYSERYFGKHYLKYYENYHAYWFTPPPAGLPAPDGAPVSSGDPQTGPAYLPFPVPEFGGPGYTGFYDGFGVPVAVDVDDSENQANNSAVDVNGEINNVVQFIGPDGQPCSDASCPFGYGGYRWLDLNIGQSADAGVDVAVAQDAEEVSP